MRKLALCLMAYAIVSFTFINATADENDLSNGNARIERFVAETYHQIDFSKCKTLSYEVFDKAYRGYLNLNNSGKLNKDRNIISICDFDLSSTEKRLWIIDLDQKKVLYNTYVAHGQGSGDEFATAFSNNTNTHQTSLGFYVTGDTYQGEHGTSLHLNGMDEGFNDAAYDRGIVVHGADYVSEKFINGQDHRLGRSWGCPAVPANLSLPIINTIKDGTCLFIYHTDTRYLHTSCWLNKKIGNLPEQNMYSSMATPMVPQKPRIREIQYISNGKVDSVKLVPVTTR